MDFLQQLGERSFYGNTLDRWIEAILVFAVWFTVLPIVRQFITRRLKALRGEQSAAPLELTLALLKRTTRIFTIAVASYLALKLLTIPPRIDKITDGVILVILWLQAGLWGSASVHFAIDQRQQREGLFDESTSSMAILRFVGLSVVWIIAVLMLLANLGVNITALVTGLGIGGVAVALALQNVLSDLFASLSIALDKPFKIGDALVIDDVTGRVEHIGIKSTRIRAVGGEQVVISNAQLLSARVRNFGRAEERRAFYTIGVTYETPADKLRRIPAIVEGIVKSLPDTRFERCHFLRFGPYSLDFEMSFYSTKPDFTSLVDLQQEFNLRLVEAFASEGVEFAYPTSRQFNVPERS
ncbi:MAG: mechanosensitive ion channel family protein [Steroidobacteraceae bacterium]|nr:mechanosensitive ion channel family protein [Steroidobacteraceae bacterium]